MTLKVKIERLETALSIVMTYRRTIAGLGCLQAILKEVIEDLKEEQKNK